VARSVVASDQPNLSVWSVDAVSVHSAPDRLDLGFLFAAGCALLAPAVSLAVGISPAWLPGASGVWRAAHLSAFDGLDVGPFTGALATQTLIFIAAILVWRALAQFGPQAGWFLPELRADGQARDLFDPARPGVLIYVARAQRTVRILVSPQLSDRIAGETVDRARQAITEGLEAGDEAGAIGRAGALLAPVP
jgi:uncharacterized membrane protein